MSTAISFTAAVLLAAVHLFSPRLRFLQEMPRARLLSIAGGISLAYVMLRILPALGAEQATLERTGSGRALPIVRDHVYVLVLLSVIVFYGLERMTKRSRERQRVERGTDETSPAVFWLKMVSFSLVNTLIGYVLVPRASLGPLALWLFTLAMLLKFVVNDHGLYADHKRRYLHEGRWLLAGAVLAGWAISAVFPLPESIVAVLQAVIAGSVLLNVLKEELPEYRESSYLAFALGAMVYAALLLSL